MSALEGGFLRPAVSSPAALVLLVCTLFVTATLARRDWDVSRFILAGDEFVQRDQTPSPITVLPHSPGYDGQMYYRLALDPFTARETAYGVTLDHPAYRVQRIGYPLIVWLLSLGQPALVPAMLVVSNLLGIGLIAYLAGRIAGELDCPEWTGVLVVYPGFFVTLSRDTTEITATAFALAAVLCLLRRREWIGVLLACCAVLCRETTLLYMSGFGLVALWRCWREGRYLSGDWLKFTLPLVLFVAWQQFLTAKLGVSPGSGAEQNVSWPFLGILTMVRDALTVHPLFFPKLWLDLLARLIAVGCGAVLLVFLFQVAAALRPSTAPLGLKISWALYACLFVCLSPTVWANPLDFLRPTADVYTTGMIVLIGARFTRSAAQERAPDLTCLASAGEHD